MNRSFILDTLRDKKKELKNKFNISKVGLFGSYSRGTQTGESDIDIVYELVQGKSLGFKEIYELEVYFKKLFNKENIDLVNLKYINPIIESEMVKSVIYV